MVKNSAIQFPISSAVWIWPTGPEIFTHQADTNAHAQNLTVQLSFLATFSGFFWKFGETLV